MVREYINFTREKSKAVKMILVDKKSQIEVERTILLGKKKSMGTINRWIREYIFKIVKKS